MTPPAPPAVALDPPDPPAPPAVVLDVAGVPVPGESPPLEHAQGAMAPTKTQQNRRCITRIPPFGKACLVRGPVKKSTADGNRGSTCNNPRQADSSSSARSSKRRMHFVPNFRVHSAISAE